MTTALYSLFDADGSLLYVGVTDRMSARFKQHAGEKDWWPQVARRTFVEYGTRAEALAAESALISSERPPCNVRVPRPPVGVGIRVRDLRRARNMRVEDLASLAPCAMQTITRIEAGKAGQIGTLLRIADALGVSLGDLISGDIAPEIAAS